MVTQERTCMARVKKIRGRIKINASDATSHVNLQMILCPRMEMINGTGENYRKMCDTEKSDELIQVTYLIRV